MSINNIFNKDLNVINIGLSSFNENLQNSGVKTVDIDWKPSVDIDSEVLKIIKEKKSLIEEANKKALEIVLNGKPVVIGLDIAEKVIPGMKKNLILHSGPPISWDRMCGPTRGAIIGALIYEGMASNPEEAEKLAASDKIEYAPCHEHSSVGPMAGIVSAFGEKN